MKTLTLNSKGKASLTVRRLAKGTNTIVVVYLPSKSSVPEYFGSLASRDVVRTR